MKEKISTLITVIIFLTMVGLITYEYNAKAQKRENRTVTAEIERVENSIIIHGIDMVSDAPMADEDPDDAMGSIIYDDSFKDTIIDYEMMKRNGISGVRTKIARTRDDTTEYDKALIETLAQRDARWHVTRHRIRSGENLWKIARRFGTDYRLIIKLNYIENPDMLRPGNSIYIPNRRGISYTVKRGDSLSAIAKRHSVTKKKIISHNSLSNSFLRIGTKLFLPDARKPVIAERPMQQQKKTKRRILATGRKTFHWPLRGRITSTFGKRTDPFTGKKKFHCGLDLSARVGTPVKAAKEGKVIFSGWKNGYGNVVIIKHDDGYITVYAHNRNNAVAVDESIQTGQVIAYSGMTGAVTGAHLHFEIRKYLTPLNPLRFLK